MPTWAPIPSIYVLPLPSEVRSASGAEQVSHTLVARPTRGDQGTLPFHCEYNKVESLIQMCRLMCVSFILLRGTPVSQLFLLRDGSILTFRMLRGTFTIIIKVKKNIYPAPSLKRTTHNWAELHPPGPAHPVAINHTLVHPPPA